MNQPGGTKPSTEDRSATVFTTIGAVLAVITLGMAAYIAVQLARDPVGVRSEDRQLLIANQLLIGFGLLASVLYRIRRTRVAAIALAISFASLIWNVALRVQ